MPDTKRDDEDTGENAPLEMSDDDFANLDLSDLDKVVNGDANKSGDDDDDDRGTDDSGSGDGGDNDSGDDDGDGDDSESGDESGAGTGDDDSGSDESRKSGRGQQPFDDDGNTGAGDDSGSDDGGDDGTGSPGDDEQGEGESSSEESELNYKAEYEKLLTPFKANGKEMRVDNVEDARTLMQMGANYNKKMAALKPNLKLMKMLQNNDLLDEEKVGYLIDLSKKDPQAIKKLIKDSKIDPEDLDLETDHDYKKSDTYTVNDNELALDDVLEDIKDNSSFSKTINIITNKWDESSKTVLANNPNIIRIIDEHVEAGAFDDIWAKVESERMLGRLNGLSDLEAYKAIGDQINEAGGFAKYQTSGSQNQGEGANKANQSKNKSDSSKLSTNKKAVDSKLRDRKKAAGSTRATSGNTGDDDFNPLSMPDDEFDKIAGSKYI